MSQNGLQTFSIHSGDGPAEQTLADVNRELAAADRAHELTFEPGRNDPETVARRYLTQLAASPAVPTITATGPGAEQVEYRTIGTETVPLTGTTVVKFAQCYHRIPVYGSLVSVELDGDNSLLAMSSAVGEPTGVDPVAAISPAQALEIIHEDAGNDAVTAPPRLYFYYEGRATPNRWRLVYMAKNVLLPDSHPAAAAGPAGPTLPQLVDYVVDAHTGELVARLPRTQSATWSPGEASTPDALGAVRQIRLECDDEGNLRLSDPTRNVRTHDFRFQDVQVLGQFLPGEFVANPPDPWDVGGISAHANAAEVADFLTTVLRRNGLDNVGGPFVSSINCTYRNRDPENREWRNAAWIGTQMVYGQRLVNGSLRSYALASDVVAHEITHGLIDRTARLEYERESGALNESYADIFGIIISNRHQSDVDRWNWELGEDLADTGLPLRDLSDPPRCQQPDHMDDFRHLAPGEMPSRLNDGGWVHVNSGIHNKAAYHLLTARAADGATVLSPREVISLFYLALILTLSRTSGFGDSRRGVDLVARTLFRNDPPALRAGKLAAVGQAFDAVGIDA